MTLLTPADIVTRRTPCGEWRTSINVYAIQRRDGISFPEATRRAEAIAYYSDDRADNDATGLAMIAAVNTSRHPI
jgi:hypothetical protein